MTDAELDPVIHAPVRLRITVMLSTLREGDYLSFSRLQQLLDLTPGNLITHMRKLEEAGYVASVKPAGDGQTRTAVYLTHGAAPHSSATPPRYASYWTRQTPPARPERPPRAADHEPLIGVRSAYGGR